MSPWACTVTPGENFVANYPSVTCGSAEHTWMRVVGGAYIGFVVAYVVYLFGVLRINRDIAYGDGIDVVEDAEGNNEDARDAYIMRFKRFQAKVSCSTFHCVCYGCKHRLTLALLRSGASSTMPTLRIRTTGTSRLRPRRLHLL